MIYDLLMIYLKTFLTSALNIGDLKMIDMRNTFAEIIRIASKLMNTFRSFFQ